jgi:hypothetical protein
MNEGKNNWMDYEPITREEYDKLRELLYKLQAILKKNQYGGDRAEGRKELDAIIYDLHKRLFRNKDRIYFYN